MAEVRDPASEMEAAELAAGAGDFTSAEQHLNRAVELEEASFGPMHAGLASILNNLGVVYERLDRPDKAEACYRRAYAVAKASLPPGDPGIELSAANLREFCAARGIPFEPSASAHGATADKPPSAQALPPPRLPALRRTRRGHGATARREGCADTATELLRTVEKPVAAVPKKAPVEPERPRVSEPVEASATSAPLMAPRTLAIASLVVVAAIVGVIFVATRSSSPTSQPEPAPTPAAATPVQEPAPAPPPAVSTPAPAPAPQDSTPARSAARAVAEGDRTAENGSSARAARRAA